MSFATYAPEAAAGETDRIQEVLANYAAGLDGADLPRETVHAATVRVIDTIGSLFAGLDGEPCERARSLANRVYPADGATILGTAQRTTVDMAAFVNATTARFAELNDVYHRGGISGGHPSDIITPLIAVAEHAHLGGRALVTAVTLGYEVALRMAEAAQLTAFDYTNLVALGTAVGSGKLLGLDVEEFRHCVAMTVVPNNALRRSRLGSLSMWKAAASGQAGRDGVFAALLAREGMQGPTRPFEGNAGWLEQVAQRQAQLDVMGGGAHPFKVQDTILKPRAACGSTISSILAAEKAHAHLAAGVRIDRVLVETYLDAKAKRGEGQHHWNPTNRESADHSIPYVVAVGLTDGTVGPAQFDEAHLSDPTIRGVLDVTEVVENPDFTRDFYSVPCLHRTRVTVWTADGRSVVGESGGTHGDISDPMGDAEVETKFLSLVEPHLGEQRARHVLQELWSLEQIDDLAALPAWLRKDQA